MRDSSDLNVVVMGCLRSIFGRHRNLVVSLNNIGVERTQALKKDSPVVGNMVARRGVCLMAMMMSCELLAATFVRDAAKVKPKTCRIRPRLRLQEVHPSCAVQPVSGFLAYLFGKFDDAKPKSILFTQQVNIGGGGSSVEKRSICVQKGHVAMPPIYYCHLIEEHLTHSLTHKHLSSTHRKRGLLCDCLALHQSKVCEMCFGEYFCLKRKEAAGEPITSPTYRPSG